jgi:hypothetical protein
MTKTSVALSIVATLFLSATSTAHAGDARRFETDFGIIYGHYSFGGSPNSEMSSSEQGQNDQSPSAEPAENLDRSPE